MFHVNLDETLKWLRNHIRQPTKLPLHTMEAHGVTMEAHENTMEAHYPAYKIPRNITEAFFKVTSLGFDPI